MGFFTNLKAAAKAAVGMRETASISPEVTEDNSVELLSGSAAISTINSIIKEALNGNLKRYNQLAEEMQRTDPHFRSVTQKRSMATRAMAITVEGGEGVKAAHRKTAQRWLDSGALQAALPSLAKGDLMGVCALEATWSHGREWLISNFELINAASLKPSKGVSNQFVFRGKTCNDPDVNPDPRYHFFYLPQFIPGAAVGSGLAMVCAKAWLLKQIALHDWGSFLHAYGKPMRLGKIPSNLKRNEKAISELKRAVQGLGKDGAAILTEDMTIEFVQQSLTGNGDAQEKFISLLDRQMSKAALGNDLTTDAGSSGGSYALGRVIGEDESDMLRAIASALSLFATGILKQIIIVNYGEQEAYPSILFSVEEPEDKAAVLANAGATLDNVAKAKALGVKVPVAPVYEALGIDVPVDQNEFLATSVDTPPMGLTASYKHGSGCQCSGCTGIRASGEEDPYVTKAEKLADQAWEELGSDFELINEDGEFSEQQFKAALKSMLGSDAFQKKLETTRAAERLAGMLDDGQS